MESASVSGIPSRWPNPLTAETTKEGVFAGGDAVTGASIAVEAIGAGRKAARSIHCYLSGEPVCVPDNVINEKKHAS